MRDLHLFASFINAKSKEQERERNQEIEKNACKFCIFNKMRNAKSNISQATVAVAYCIFSLADCLTAPIVFWRCKKNS